MKNIEQKKTSELILQQLFCGDNLEIMSQIPSESVDLEYIDPPFFTSRHYEVIWGDSAEKRAFEDRWVKNGENGRFSKDINVYLDFMEPRLKEIHRILKPTGSFYLHCDDNASHYLKIICDQIFGYNNFVEEIIWHKKGGLKGTQKMFPRKKDTILFYVKNIKSNYTFHVLRKETKENALYSRWIKYSKDGETVLFKDFPVADKVKLGVYTKRFISQHGREPDPDDVIYEFEGAIMDSVWEDIADIYRSKSEKLGYPTQKPEALLERIITASSDEGDVIFDAFCGCGTTISVAKRLGRQYIGIDISPTACRLIANRIKHPLSQIIGLPLNSVEIEGLSGFEFQNAVIRALDPSLTTIKVGGKGADGGIDGSYYDILISVKKYRAGRVDLDQFIATLYRNQEKKVGIFIALGFSSEFTKEVSRLRREQKIEIHAFTLSDIIDQKLHENIISAENKKHGKLM